MRRGRNTFVAAAVIAAALLLVVVSGAFAATPQDICKDLQDGKIDGTYTAAEWTAFFQDSTVQGYCSPIAVVTPPPTTTTSTPPVTTTSTSTPPVPLTPTTPTVTSGVAGAQHVVTKPAPSTPRTTGVKGSTHTVQTPKAASAAPITAVRRSGTLPFTGAQLTLFLLVGLGLVATGLVLRASGRRAQD